MNLKIQSKSSKPIYDQIAQQIKEAVLNGELKEGDALPSIRALAADLKISVITTKRAYTDLEQEGMIYSVPGKGFFVDNPDMQYLQEKKTVGIEDDLAKVLDKAQASGLAKEDVISMIDILWEESK